MKIKLSAVASVLLSSLLGSIAAIAVSEYIGHHDRSPGRDGHFARIGRRYQEGLGFAYADAWEYGAAQLGAGDSLGAASAAVGYRSDANRARLFDEWLTPEFAKIVPAAHRDAGLTPLQRDALVKAWRGLAHGLRGYR